MTERPKRGAFIVVEGLDRSGKSTQAAILLDRLQSLGLAAKLIKFPGQPRPIYRTTAIGKMIDSYLRSQSELDDRAIHLLFSANRWELAPVIEEMLRAGTTVICDRYAFSGIAFSAAKEAAGLSYNWCRAPDIGLPAPDLTLFLDVSPEKAKARGGYGAERYEREDVQMRVRAVFERIGEEMGEQVGEDGRWVSIDADAGKEDVAETVWTLAERLCRGIDRPVSKLWVDDNEKERNSQMYM